MSSSWEGEYGTVEEITSTYVVIQLWDWRRMVLPLSYFIEKPFQNWTSESSSIIGAVTFNVDYSTDVPTIRSKLNEIVAANPRWDRRVVSLQVTDPTAETIQLRAHVSAATSAAAWDLRCEVPEELIEFVNTRMPGCLPRRRQQVVHREVVAPATDVEARQSEKMGLAASARARKLARSEHRDRRCRLRGSPDNPVFCLQGRQSISRSKPATSPISASRPLRQTKWRAPAIKETKV
ncbi:mechanosensitive ion channel family protein [Bradyrhizobium sp. AZCC 1610]|uniref:mechanosensitive ion channel family protein n=1 Tax=Bradyrhizobium sp. AZCC 1610 TaxID=3117020 RepID=UPI002FF026B1